jgi:hypothetical protein
MHVAQRPLSDVRRCESPASALDLLQNVRAGPVAGFPLKVLTDLDTVVREQADVCVANRIYRIDIATIQVLRRRPGSLAWLDA